MAEKRLPLMSTSAIVIRTLFSFPSPLSNRCRGFQQSAGIIVMENSVALERSTNLFRSRTTVKDPNTLRPGDYKSCRRRTFLRNLILPLPLSLSLSHGVFLPLVTPDTLWLTRWNPRNRPTIIQHRDQKIFISSNAIGWVVQSLAKVIVCLRLSPRKSFYWSEVSFRRK